MILPIDYRKRPFKDKYLDQETPVLNRWFIFGHYDNGCVGISDGTDDIFEHVPLETAELICKARNAFVDAVMTQVNGEES